MNIIRRKRNNLFIPLNAMCDIAFLLFIFIVVISSVNSKKPADFQFAKSENVQKAGDVDAEFFLDADGKCFYRGNFIEIREIENILNGLRIEKTEISVALTSHKKCKYKNVEQVWTEIEKSGCNKITLFLRKK